MNAEQVPAVDVRDAIKTFGSGADTVRALDGVSVAIRENEFFTLLGPSGCGKTTMLRLIAGFEQPSAGAILLGGEDITHLPPFQRPVNTVFQSYALFPHMTVGQNVAFGLEMQDIAKADITGQVDEMLSLVKLSQLKGRKPAQLSGGQQQRVALARALANHPKVLLLDEPLSALDLKLRKEMQIELKRLQHETGITFIFVTHDQEEALTMSDRIAVMEAGQILQVGSPTEIYEHPTRRFVADFIGEINFLPGVLTTVEGGTAVVRLPGDIERRAAAPDGIDRVGRVTVAVRPERVSLSRDVRPRSLAGEVANIVYFGTDTIYYLRITDDQPFTVRMQNRKGAAAPFAIGDRLGIEIPDGALQVLRD